jgi:hypothetical protein
MPRPLPEEVQTLYVPRRQEQITFDKYDVISVLGGFLIVYLFFIYAGI